MNRKHSTSNSQLPTLKFSEEVGNRWAFDVRCFRGEMVHGPDAWPMAHGGYPATQQRAAHSKTQDRHSEIFQRFTPIGQKVSSGQS